ncbi:hypothetical protein HJFPF1_08163 [Paramyrothecium foliicola]|nr:hypothetical protein HJFPF1_08163 [Paramyrothecium foliicola]
MVYKPMIPKCFITVMASGKGTPLIWASEDVPMKHKSLHDDSALTAKSRRWILIGDLQLQCDAC